MQLEEDKTGIIIITYNTSQLIDLQVKCIRKFCKDNEHDIIIVDNSDHSYHIQALYQYCRINKVKFQPFIPTTKDFSKSHAEAANWSYNRFKDKYRYLFYLDHDCFPVKDFSVSEILEEQLITGIHQGTRTSYLWPGCLFIRTSIGEVDFSCNSKLGLDTGGNTYKIVKNIKLFLDYIDEQYEYIDNTEDFYSMLCDSTFMHFIKGSNWNNNPNYETRIEKLINILKQKAGL